VTIKISKVSTSDVDKVPVHWVSSADIRDPQDVLLPQLRASLFPFFFIRNRDDLELVRIYAFECDNDEDNAKLTCSIEQCARRLPNVKFESSGMTRDSVVCTEEHTLERIHTAEVPSDLNFSASILDLPPNQHQQLLGQLSEETLNRFFHRQLAGYSQHYWRSSHNPMPILGGNDDTLGFDFELPVHCVIPFFQLFGDSIHRELAHRYPNARKVLIEVKHWSSKEFKLSRNEKSVADLQENNPYVLILVRPSPDASDVSACDSFFVIFWNPQRGPLNRSVVVQTAQFPPNQSVLVPMVLELHPSVFSCKFENPTVGNANAQQPERLAQRDDRGHQDARVPNAAYPRGRGRGGVGGWGRGAGRGGDAARGGR
jgi:hypothetical protein